MRLDFNRHLMVMVRSLAMAFRGVERPELLLHPSDRRTGLKYSLLPMTQSIIADSLPASGATSSRAHPRAFAIPRWRPPHRSAGRLPWRPQTMFRRAESSSFFGREIGLMYVHAHLRYAESMAILATPKRFGKPSTGKPITVTERLAHGRLRQRNAISAAATPRLPTVMPQVPSGGGSSPDVGVEGGWRIYSSGPGIFISFWSVICLGTGAFGANMSCNPCCQLPF